jgi:proteic killer suppression protein
MIRSFRHKGLADLFATSKSAKIRSDLRARVVRRLDALHAADELKQLIISGFDFHALRGHKPTRYSLHVNGPWCITFEWVDGDTWRIDLEQYH